MVAALTVPRLSGSPAKPDGIHLTMRKGPDIGTPMLDLLSGKGKIMDYKSAYAAPELPASHNGFYTPPAAEVASTAGAATLG